MGESLNDLADPRLRARKSAGEVVGSIEDTSVDPSQEPGKRNEVVAELEAAKNPMGASDKPVTVTTVIRHSWLPNGLPRRGVNR